MAWFEIMKLVNVGNTFILDNEEITVNFMRLMTSIINQRIRSPIFQVILNKNTVTLTVLELKRFASKIR